MNLEGKIALITGASSGIGEAVARDLREAGAKLVVTARRADRLEALANELGDTVPVAADITIPETPQRLIDTAVERLGACDIVVNNAGIMDAGTVDDLDVERVALMVRVNVEAAFRLIYTALKHWKARGEGGQLVNVSSILGTKVRPTTGPYAATKHAIEALSEALRMELAGSGIRVMCVEPGLVMTGLHDHWETHPKDGLGITPLSPGDIARCVRFALEQPDEMLVARILAMPSDHSL